MLQDTLVAAKPKRISSLDGVKGFLSLKIALAHVSFFVIAPMLAPYLGIARDLSFPVLLFAFGVGNGISKRRKPVYPLVILALALLAGSVLNEMFLDHKIAAGFLTGEHPMPGGAFARLAVVIELIRGAHYTDFLHPYLLYLSLGLMFDRLKMPMRSWAPWILITTSAALSALGFYLIRQPYHGPFAQLWSGGYHAFQYAPLFVTGLLVGAYRKQWLATIDTTRGKHILLLVAKLVAVKFFADGVDWIHPHMGVSADLWKAGDPVSVLAGASCGLLLFSAYSDAVDIFKSGRVLTALQTVGRRTIISLCLQMIILPIAGILAVDHLHSQAARAAFGLSAWGLFVVMVLQWHRISALFLPKKTVTQTTVLKVSLGPTTGDVPAALPEADPESVPTPV
jgi:hypothetical protein